MGNSKVTMPDISFKIKDKTSKLKKLNRTLPSTLNSNPLPSTQEGSDCNVPLDNHQKSTLLTGSNPGTSWRHARTLNHRQTEIDDESIRRRFDCQRRFQS